jgi:two-component system chemotaxis sensor kinase CheA
VTEPDAELLEVFREEATERVDHMVETLLALESGHAQSDAIDSLFRDAHSIKGSAGMVGVEEVRAIAHKMEDALEDARERGEFSQELTDPMLRATDALRSAVGGESGIASAALQELSAAIAQRGGVSEGTAAAPEVAQAAEPKEPDASAKAPESRSMRMSTEKVDRLFEAVGETVLHSRRLERLVGGGAGAEREDDHLEGELGRGELMLSELQDSVIQLRTLPLSSITARFPRAVRDLAAERGRQVELQISGADTQLDRMILDGISETISHLLSNAVAHGIEPPEERERAGKSARGRIELRAGQRGSLVAIEVADDGRGVAPEVLEKAGDGGALVDTLAEAGFSTAEEITEVSGRGVGLDAVKSHVESLGGRLEVQSAPGEGTTVTMLLPLTLALLRVLVVERSGQRFGLPLTSVEEALIVLDTMSLGGSEAIEVRGRSIPLADLGQIIGGGVQELPERPQAVIVASSGRRVAALCDRIVEEQEAVVKSLGPLLARVSGYLGAALMDDGGIALILDPAFLTKRLPRGASAGVTPEEEKPPTKVLVVDDQFTVRELQRSILEAAGYRVETARDGREALTKVTGDQDIELVVTDLEMPEMDGIELLQTIRASGSETSLPVVVVTSRTGEEDRRRGLDAGADAYIVKDEFDQKALLETVGRLLTR